MMVLHGLRCSTSKPFKKSHPMLMQLTRTQRAATFWLVCIPLRIYLATRGDRLWLRLFALPVGVRWITGAGFAQETMFGGDPWWQEERPLHGVLWLAYAATGNKRFLQADTLFGATNWLTSTPARG